MGRNRETALGFTVVLVLGGCVAATRTHVSEVGEGHFEVVAWATSEHTAEEDAYEAARRTCKSRGRLEPSVLFEDCYYRGMNRQARAGMAVAGAFLGNMVGTYGAGQARHDVRGTTFSDEDYRFVLRFECIASRPKTTQSILNEIF